MLYRDTKESVGWNHWENKFKHQQWRLTHKVSVYSQPRLHLRKAERQEVIHFLSSPPGTDSHGYFTRAEGNPKINRRDIFESIKGWSGFNGWYLEQPTIPGLPDQPNSLDNQQVGI